MPFVPFNVTPHTHHSTSCIFYSILVGKIYRVINVIGAVVSARKITHSSDGTPSATRKSQFEFICVDKFIGALPNRNIVNASHSFNNILHTTDHMRIYWPPNERQNKRMHHLISGHRFVSHGGRAHYSHFLYTSHSINHSVFSCFVHLSGRFRTSSALLATNRER